MNSLLTVVLTFGDPTHCAPLVDHLKTLEFTVPDLPATVNAGSGVPFQIEAKKSFTLDPARYNLEFSNVELFGDTGVPYPTGLRLDQGTFLLDYLLAPAAEYSQTFIVQPRPTFGGDLRLALRVSLLDADHEYCVAEGTLDRRLVVTTKSLDVTPPLLTALAFDKPEYRAGETVTATLTLSEPLRELTTDHVEFGEGEHGFPGYLSDAVYTFAATDTPNTYVLSFVVPADTPAGDYVLAWFNRFDAHDNFEDQVGGVDQNEKAVALSHPLRVVSGN